MDRKYKLALGLFIVLIIGAFIGGSLVFRLSGGDAPRPGLSIDIEEMESYNNSTRLKGAIYFENDARANIKVKNTSVVFLDGKGEVIKDLCIGDIPRNSETSFEFEVTLDKKPREISISPEKIQTNRKWRLTGVIPKNGSEQLIYTAVKDGEGDWTRSKNSFEYDTTNLSCETR